MIEGNQIEQNSDDGQTEVTLAPIKLSKTEVLVHRGMGENVSQLANRYGLSASQMKMALIEMGVLKGDAVNEASGKLTEREQKFVDVCNELNIETEAATMLLEKLGLTYKTGRRAATKENAKKYIIINDLNQ